MKPFYYYLLCLQFKILTITYTEFQLELKDEGVSYKSASKKKLNINVLELNIANTSFFLINLVTFIC